MIGVYDNCRVIIGEENILDGEPVVCICQSGRVVPENMAMPNGLEILEIDVPNVLPVDNCNMDSDVFFLYTSKASVSSFPLAVLEILQKVAIWHRDFAGTSVGLAMPQFAFSPLVASVLGLCGISSDKIQLWQKGHYTVRRMYTTDYAYPFEFPIPNRTIGLYKTIRDIVQQNDTAQHRKIDACLIAGDGDLPEHFIPFVTKDNFVVVSAQNDITYVVNALDNIETVVTSSGPHLLHILFCRIPPKSVVVIAKNDKDTEYYILVLQACLGNLTVLIEII